MYWLIYSLLSHMRLGITMGYDETIWVILSKFPDCFIEAKRYLFSKRNNVNATI